MRAFLVLVPLLFAGCEPESSTCVLNIGIDVSNFTVDGYNQVVRLSTGAGSWTWGCPGGGSAAITGTVSNPTMINYNLTWSFSSCTVDTLTLTGSMQDTVTNGVSSTGKIQNLTSAALTIRGDVSGCNADPIDATCAVSISSSSGYVVDVCGLTYP